MTPRMLLIEVLRILILISLAGLIFSALMGVSLGPAELLIAALIILILSLLSCMIREPKTPRME